MPTKKSGTRAKSTKAKETKQTKVVSQPTESKSGFSNYFKFGESYTSLILGIVVVIISTILLLSFVNNKNAARPENLNKQIAKTNLTVSPAPTSVVTATPTMTVVTPEVTNTPTPTLVKSEPTAKPTSKPTVAPTKQVQPTPTVQPKQEKVAKGSTYTIVAGDTLWKISEKVYHDGYKWTEIARANNLDNPSVIHVGNKLKLPKIEVKNTTTKIAQEPKTGKTADSVTPTPIESGPTVVKTVKITGNSYTIAHGDDLWDIAVRAYGDGYKWTEIARANNLTNASLIHAGNVIKIPRN